MEAKLESSFELDPTDLRILESLQSDASLSNQSLAAQVHVSPATCLRRVKRLAQAGIDYEYLDGRTRDRQAPVHRFQTDPKCGVFLISLKAGGLGLNLTAAEYVFLLDPWWNPAVEAQAIDRAHRIGQTRPVFAYRLIARDTVEERIAELQQKKRALADSVIRGDGAPLQGLTVEDLERLFS